MANTGHKWSDPAFVQLSADDWDADALADSAEAVSDEVSLDQKTSAKFGLTLTEDNTGAISGTVTVYILGTDGTTYEESGQGSPKSFEVTPVQNATVFKPFRVDPGDYPACKIAVANNSGQELAVSLKYQTADMPVAS